MAQVQARPVKKLPALRGRTVVNLFFEDSTRTRSSFELAGKWLSADVINVSAKGSSVSKGESLRDTVLTVAAMGVDALVIRHGASGAPRPGRAVGRRARAQRRRRHPRAPDPGPARRLHPAPALPHRRAGPRRPSPASGSPSSATSPTPASPAATCCCCRPWAPRSSWSPRRRCCPPASRPGRSTRQQRLRRGAARGRRRDDAARAARADVGRLLPDPREYTVGYGLTRARLAAHEARLGDLPPRPDEPRPGDLRRRRRRGQLADPRPGGGRRRRADERALPAAGRRGRRPATRRGDL